MKRTTHHQLVGSVLGLCLLLSVGCAARGVTVSERTTQAPMATLPLKPYFGDLKSIDVTAGDKTVPFLFDTGGGLTCITPEVARNVGCTPFGRLTGFRSIGERLDLERCGKIPLRLGSASLEIELAVFDLMPLLKQQGDVPLAGGMASLDMFAGLPLTLDFTHGTLVIESPASLVERVKSMKPISVRFQRQAGGAALDLFLEIQAKTGTIWLEVDSGNAGPVRLSPHAIKQLGLNASLNDRVDVTLEVRGLGALPNDAYVDERIYDGLLNTIFLKQIVLTVDFSTGRAWARKHAE